MIPSDTMASESEVKLTVGEQRVEAKDVTKGQDISMTVRDPEHLHDDHRVRKGARAEHVQSITFPHLSLWHRYTLNTTLSCM